VLRYGDFSIFYNGGRGRLGFLKSRNFNGRKGQGDQTASMTQSAKFHGNRSNRC